MWERTSSSPNSVWDAAWQWVLRQHDEGFEDPQFNAALHDWLRADPAHGRAYDQASRIWAIAGLVPPVNDMSATDGASPISATDGDAPA